MSRVPRVSRVSPLHRLWPILLATTIAACSGAAPATPSGDGAQAQATEQATEGVTGAPTRAPQTRTPERTPAAGTGTPGNLGTNLGAITYYDGLVVFANLVDQAGDWIPQREGGTWGSGDPLDLRPDGWPRTLAPGQYASTVIADVHYPAGTYAVNWQGQGTFRIAGQPFDATGGSSGSGPAPGTPATISLDGTSTVVLDILATNPADPLRAIDVRVPGESPTAVFRTAYVESLGFYRALRFMDWTRTNNAAWEEAPARSCATRVTPGYYSQGTSAGASVERMVGLANLLHADPWFTIPHTATADWTTCIAGVVADLLAADLTPRFELSNETWNPTFRAFGDLTADAEAHNLGGGDSYLGLQLEHGARHAAAMALVDAEFAKRGRTARHVLAGQAANAWVLEQRLSAPGAADATDELAIAPYLGVPNANPFDPAEAASLAGLTLPELFARLDEAQTAEVEPWIAAHVDLAASAGKTLVAYEGGQHLAGDSGNDALTALFTGANRDAAMGDRYATYLARWQELTGNALFMHFTDAGPYTQWGSWGAVEDPSAPGGPKWEALAAFAGASVADATAPVVTSGPVLAFRAGAAVGPSGVLPMTVRVSAADVSADGEPSPSGVASVQVSRRVNGGAWSAPVTVSVAPVGGAGGAVSAAVPVSVAAAGIIAVRVRARDVAGNTSAWVEGPVLRPRLLGERSTALRWGGTWGRAASTAYLGGAVATSGARGAWVQVSGRLAAVALVTVRGPGRGAVRPIVDGVAGAAMDTRAAAWSPRRLVATRAWRDPATHTIRLVVLGTSGRPRVDVDALAVLLAA